MCVPRKRDSKCVFEGNRDKERERECVVRKRDKKRMCVCRKIECLYSVCREIESTYVCECRENM